MNVLELIDKFTFSKLEQNIQEFYRLILMESEDK